MDTDQSNKTDKNKMHLLKTWPVFFEAVRAGTKTFEARKDDRGFQVGDSLVLEEWNPETHAFTGELERRKIGYILRNTEHVAPGYCIIGFEPAGESLPQESGFYWWRSSGADPWRMVQVIDLALSGPDAIPAPGHEPRLVAYDVGTQSFGGRSLSGWKEFFAIGKWIKVEKPA